MNEAETRAEHIDPALAAAGWGVVEGSRITREFRDIKLAVIEALKKSLWLFMTLSKWGLASLACAHQISKCAFAEVAEVTRSLRIFAGRIWSPT